MKARWMFQFNPGVNPIDPGAAAHTAAQVRCPVITLVTVCCSEPAACCKHFPRVVLGTSEPFMGRSVLQMAIAC